jgi:hypothetical protein
MCRRGCPRVLIAQSGHNNLLNNPAASERSALAAIFPPACFRAQFPSEVRCGRHGPMDCETCNHLFAAYPHSVSLFRATVRKGAGTIRDDSRAVVKEAARVSRQCRDGNEALMAHWREHQGYFDKSGGSSE